MRIQIFLLLLFCAVQQLDGSNSAKKKGGSRLKKIFKNSLILFAVNYGANEVNAGEPQAAEPSFLACKYNLPDQNAGVMMNFVVCAKDQGFEKYMFDNSENCPEIKELYGQAESDGHCAFNTSKFISDGALARFRGEQLSHATNVEMLKTHLMSYSGQNGALFKSEDSVSDLLRKWDDLFPKTDFDFFQFKGVLELTNFVYPKDVMTSAITALRICGKYKDLNTDNAKRVLELTKLVYPNDAMAAVSMALSEYKDVNVNAKKLFELTSIAYPDDKDAAVKLALLSKYKDINVEHASRVLELTKLAFPNDKIQAVATALFDEYKDVNVENAKKLVEFTKVAYPDDARHAVLVALAWDGKHYLNYKDVNVENAKRMFELTKLAFPNDTEKAAVTALRSDLKDAEREKGVLALTKIAFPNDTDAVAMELHSKYKDVNAENTKNLFELAKLAFHNDAMHSVLKAQLHLSNEFKHVNAENGKKLFKLTNLAYPNNKIPEVMVELVHEYQNVNAEKAKELSELVHPYAIMKEAFKKTYPEILKEDF